MHKSALAMSAGCALVGAFVMADVAVPLSAHLADLATQPCAPVLGGGGSGSAPAPSPPSGLRIIRGDAEPQALFFDEPPEQGPFVAEVAPAAAANENTPYPYFDGLSLRPDCLVAYHMRSQSQLDAIQTRAKSEKKQPVTYDPSLDAALFSIFAPVTTDSQQKVLPVRATGSTVLLTWDFRFDQYFRWNEAGNIATHKTWRFDDSAGGPWLALKTDYQRATNQKAGLAEFYMSVPSNKYIPPGTVRGGREIPEPRVGEFFIQANTWTRAWWMVEDLGQAIVKVSLWVADETRGPVQLYNRVGIYAPAAGFDKALFRMEYDTSMDTATNPTEMHTWNRNYVVLSNISQAAVQGILQRPAK